jgi:hypothetical protein
MILTLSIDQILGTLTAYEMRISKDNPPLEKHHLKKIRMRISSLMKLKQNL